MYIYYSNVSYKACTVEVIQSNGFFFIGKNSEKITVSKSYTTIITSNPASNSLLNSNFTPNNIHWYIFPIKKNVRRVFRRLLYGQPMMTRGARFSEGYSLIG